MSLSTCHTPHMCVLNATGNFHYKGDLQSDKCQMRLNPPVLAWPSSPIYYRKKYERLLFTSENPADVIRWSTTSPHLDGYDPCDTDSQLFFTGSGQGDPKYS